MYLYEGVGFGVASSDLHFLAKIISEGNCELSIRCGENKIEIDFDSALTLEEVNEIIQGFEQVAKIMQKYAYRQRVTNNSLDIPPLGIYDRRLLSKTEGGEDGIYYGHHLCDSRLGLARIGGSEYFSVGQEGMVPSFDRRNRHDYR